MFRKRNVRKRYQTAHCPPFINQYLDSFQENHKKKDFFNTRFVVFDTETTGLNRKKDKVISIAGVSLVNMAIQVEDSFEILVQNSSSGTSESIVIHRILKKELQDGLTEKEALRQFLNFIGNSVMVAHFAEFDMGIMSQMLKNHFGMPLLNPSIDTIRLAQRLESHHWATMAHPDPKSFSLDCLCEKHKIEINGRHTAAGDALATARLFQILLCKARKRGLKKTGDLI